jgi:DNA-binding NarL/FixJ family response regulator
MAVSQTLLQPKHQPISAFPVTISESRMTPACTICSNHPLVRRLTHEALLSDSVLGSTVKMHLDSSKPFRGGKQQILILDTCSVEDWLTRLGAWRAEGGATIALISSEAYTGELELQLLYLGASGVLAFDSLMNNLPKAVHCVSKDCLWIRREVLNLYVKRTNGMIRQALTSDHRLTARENQIVGLLRTKVSNKTIAQKLSISERTAKFHTSNILRKLNLTSRREIQALDPAALMLGNSSRAPQANPNSRGVMIMAPQSLGGMVPCAAANQRDLFPQKMDHTE